MRFLAPFKAISRFAEDLLKGPDNKYWDIGRVLLIFVGNLGLVLGTAWEVVTQFTFDASEFGTAFGLINSTGIGSIVVRDKMKTGSPSMEKIIHGSDDSDEEEEVTSARVP